MRFIRWAVRKDSLCLLLRRCKIPVPETTLGLLQSLIHVCNVCMLVSANHC